MINWHNKRSGRVGKSRFKMDGNILIFDIKPNALAIHTVRKELREQGDKVDMIIFVDEAVDTCGRVMRMLKRFEKAKMYGLYRNTLENHKDSPMFSYMLARLPDHELVTSFMELYNNEFK